MNQKHYVGEKNTNSFGSEMVISKYVNSKDIDVFFPTYNWTAKNVYCSNFVRGKIKCPYEPRLCNIGFAKVRKTFYIDKCLGEKFVIIS